MTRDETRRPPIKSIKSLGTTWYDRGPAYWARRVLFVGYALIGVAFSFTIVAAFLNLIVQHLDSDTGLSLALLAICIPVIATSLYIGLRPLRRSTEDKAAGRPMTYNTGLTRRRRAGVGAGAGATGYAASTGSAVAGGAVFLAAFAFLGHCVGNLVVSCQKYLTQEEFDAAKEADRWLERHGSR
ncbi:hypothetical protein G3I13_19880 [Streptomyces sp. SID6673]|nr:hypothetical protein [Streptomyces sp. SID11726]NEB26598.1 hypothetical protein [Streptomyces sp. SID6673]